MARIPSLEAPFEFCCGGGRSFRPGNIRRGLEAIAVENRAEIPAANLSVGVALLAIAHVERMGHRRRRRVSSPN